MFQAKYCGVDFFNACLNGSTGRVHSVFNQAVNIQLNRLNETLLTITRENMDMFCSNLSIIANGESLLNHFNIDDIVIFTFERIYVNNVAIIAMDKVQTWERQSDENIHHFYHGFKHNIVLGNCRELKEVIAMSKKSDLDYPQLKWFDVDVCDWIGKGSGLTPSGDDFLAGFLHAGNYLSKLFGKEIPEFSHFKSRIEFNLHRTGSISRHFLSYALRSEWGKYTEDILMNLGSKNTNILFKYVEQKMAVGASSGVDEVMGLIYGFEQLLKFPQSNL